MVISLDFGREIYSRRLSKEGWRCFDGGVVVIWDLGWIKGKKREKKGDWYILRIIDSIVWVNDYWR